jgi:[protein-PII] uridylyltransferase
MPPVPPPDFAAAVRGGAAAVRAAYGGARAEVLAGRRALGGLGTARALAAAADALVRALAEAASPRSAGFAVLAVGGYGRGELSPFSDVDLVVVAPRRAPAAREIAASLASALWDAGAEVNLTLRTPRGLLRAMGRDHAIASSILDRRLLAGDPAVAGLLDAETVPAFLRARGAWFLAGKADEARRRRAARGGSPAGLEPDVKESPGGLRDCHAARWLRALDPPGTPDGVPAEALGEILRFRAELHLLAGRRQDLLDLPSQKALVPILLPGEEGDPGELHLRALAPWFRAARAAARALDRALGDGPGPPALPEDARGLLALLASPGPAAPALRALHRDDRLAALLPEFGPLTALPQCDPYHAWTVDEHTLRALEALDAAAEGRGPGGARLAEEARRLPSLLVPRAALLLHDAGKTRGARGHAARGAIEARDAPGRLGLGPAEARAVLRLVEIHTVLGEASALAVRGDEGPVRRVAEAAGDRDTLRTLLLVTAADIAGVGRGAWTAWRAAQLLDLHDRVEASLRGAPAGAGDLGDALRASLPPARWAEASAFVERVPPRYRATADLRSARLHLDLLRRRARLRGGPAAAADDRPGAVEFAVAAPDRPHLFADLAGAIALRGLDILAADAHTLADGTALDAFTVRAPGAARRAALAALAAAAAAAPGSVDAEVRRFARRVPAGARPRAEARVEARRADDGTGSAAELRVECPDRPGLLHDLARALSAAGCDLRQVRVATLGPRALDAFFVTRGGRAPAPGEETAALLDALRAAAGGEPDPGVPGPGGGGAPAAGPGP